MYAMQPHGGEWHREVRLRFGNLYITGADDMDGAFGWKGKPGLLAACVQTSGMEVQDLDKT